MLYVAYTTEFPLGSPDSQVIRTTPLPHSPVDRVTTVEAKQIFTEIGSFGADHLADPFI